MNYSGEGFLNHANNQRDQGGLKDSTSVSVFVCLCVKLLLHYKLCALDIFADHFQMHVVQ